MFLPELKLDDIYPKNGDIKWKKKHVKFQIDYTLYFPLVGKTSPTVITCAFHFHYTHTKQSGYWKQSRHSPVSSHDDNTLSPSKLTTMFWSRFNVFFQTLWTSDWRKNNVVCLQGIHMYQMSLTIEISTSRNPKKIKYKAQ